MRCRRSDPFVKFPSIGAILVLLVGLGNAFGAEVAHGQSPFKGNDEPQLRAEILRAWARFVEEAKWVGPFTSTWRVRVYRNGELRVDKRTYSKRNHSCVLWGDQVFYAHPKEYAKGSAREWLVVLNPAYAFQIQRNEPDRGWALASLTPGTDRERFSRFEEQRKAMTRTDIKKFRGAFVPLERPLEEVMTSSEFIIYRASDSDPADRELRVVLENKTEVQENSPDSMIRWLVLTLDVEHGCWIKECEYAQRSLKYHWGWWESKWQSKVVKSSLEHQRIPVATMVVDKGQSVDYDAGGTVVRVLNTVIEAEAESREMSRVPSDEEFRLSYYGLPEPAGIVWPKPTPWWLYILLSGLALVLLGLAIYAYRRWRLRQTFAA